MRTVRPAQAEALLWLLDHPRGALFLPMGFGKTFTVLTALSMLGWPRTLVVAPKRVASDTWPDELDNTAPGVSYAVLTGDMTAARRVRALASVPAVTVVAASLLAWLTAPGTARAVRAELGRPLPPWECAVVDELSQYKTVSSRRSRALASIVNGRERPGRVWGLTGTPMADHEEALYGEMRIVDGGETFGPSVERFRRKYLRPENPWVEHSRLVIRDEAAARELSEKVAPKVLAVDASRLAALLPDRVDDRVPVRPGAEFMREYASFAEHQVTEFCGYTDVAAGDGTRLGRVARLGPDSIGAATAAALRNKLRQFTAGFLYRDDHSVKWHDYSKIEAAVDLVERLEGEPVLIFYGFVPEKDELLTNVPGARLLDKTFDLEAWNSGRIPVLLAHPAAAGHGLNLQHGAAHMVWTTVPESNELYRQACARLVRPGASGDTVWVHHLVVPGTVDEVVLEDKARKSGADRRLFEHLAEIGGVG